MTQIMQLIKRNFKLYIRDKSAVAFSLLTMMIVIGLMILFLGDMNVNSIVSLLEEFGVSDLETGRTNAKGLILMWTLAGVISMNSITVSISILGTMIQDQASGRYQAFCVSPIRKISLALGYIGASFLGSMVICLITLGISDCFAIINRISVFNFSEHLTIILMIAVNSFCYSCIMFFAAQWIKSTNAWSGFSTIIGTLAGFLGAIYLPMGALPSGVQTFLKCTPILYSTANLRKLFTQSMIQKTFSALPQTAVEEYQKVMGITITINDHTIGCGLQVAFLILCGIIVLLMAALIMKKRTVLDR